jgi:hypothetical protein
LNVKFKMKLSSDIKIVFLVNALLLSLRVSFAAECSNWQPPTLQANYTPLGRVVEAAGMEIGVANASRALIARW